MGEERLQEQILGQTINLVEKMFAEDTLGTPLVSKQIIELQLNQGTTTTLRQADVDLLDFM